MDAVAFPPPPPPFLDDDFDFGDFTFAPAAPQPAPPSPQPAAFAAFDDDWGDFVASSLGSNPDGGSAPTTQPTDMSAAGAWEKPRGPLPLSLFGDDKEEDDEGPPMPPPTTTATAHQRTPSFESKGSRAADLKDLIVGLYGSQLAPATDAPEASTPEVVEDDDGFGEDGWEFKGAPSSVAGQEGGEPAHGEGIQDTLKSLVGDQEDWSVFTCVNNKLNNAQSTDHVGNQESTGQSMKTFSYHPGSSDNEITVEETSFVHTEPLQDGSAPPVVTTDMEILHDKVKKQVIKEGQGKTPLKFSTCFVHYRAWVQSSGHKFEDTWQEQQPVEIVIGKEKKQMAGLGIGVGNMRRGERALLHVGWELGYGKEGSFSFPNVPPTTDLIYEVELIGFDDAKEGKARSDMTVEERIEAADRRKLEGNDYFKEKKFDEAMQQYEMAVAYMGDDFMFQLFGKYRDMALAVKNPCHLNTAACLIKQKKFDEAIAQCSIVLSEDETNVKALFRRGKAKAELGQTESAREDFLKAKKHSPEDKEITRELRLLAEQDKAMYKKQKELYKGLFGPRPQPKPKTTNPLLVFWQWLLSLVSYLAKMFRRKND